MNVTILGSGSFFIDKEHSAPAYLVQVDGKNILLDCGPGTMNQMAKIGFDPLDLNFIFITHFHADHSSDLFSILSRFNLSQKYYGGESKNLKIFGPKGIKDFAEKVAEAYLLGFILDNPGFEFEEFGEKIEIGEINIYPKKVEHLGIDSFALRFEDEGKIFTYTGDSAISQGVVEAAKNADLLITDCATPKDKPATAHLSTTQVGEICRDNGVKKVILSHQVPPGYNVDMVSQVKEVFGGEVILAKDLMAVEL